MYQVVEKSVAYRRYKTALESSRPAPRNFGGGVGRYGSGAVLRL